MSGRSSKALPKKLAKPKQKPKGGPGGLFGIGELDIIERELLGLLLNHYGIKDETENRWYLLSLALAREHIPAFQEESRGRDKSWSDKHEALLYLQVRNLAPKFDGNESEACRQLIKEPPYSGMVIDWRSLRSRVQRAKSKNPTVVHLIEKLRQAKQKALVGALRGQHRAEAKSKATGKQKALADTLRGCDEKKA